jgi:hypothetical protein
MKLGLAEIILLLIIAAVVLIVFRGMPASAGAAPPPPVRQPTPEEIEEARIKSGRRFRLRALGGVFLVIGLLVLASTLKVFEILFSAYAGAILIMLAGVVILFMSARK